MENAEPDILSSLPGHLALVISLRVCITGVQFMSVISLSVSLPLYFFNQSLNEWQGKRTQMHIGIWQRVFQLMVYTIEATFREPAFKVK